MTGAIPIELGRLTAEHVAHLRASGLSDETLALASLYSLRGPSDVAAVLGRKTWRQGGGGIAFPILRPGRTAPELVRVKPDRPRTATKKKKPKPIKYDQRGGSGIVIYYPPRTLTDRLRASTQVVWTEGEKKALALDQLGYAAIGLTGVSCAHDTAERKVTGRSILHPWLREDLRVEGREHVIAYDSDASTNSAIMQAAQRLAGMLIEAGASGVRFAAIPPAADGAKQGVDDLLVAAGPDAVRAAIDAAQPIVPADTRPQILIRTAEHEVSAEAIRALVADPDIYQRGRQLVRVLPAEVAGDGALEGAAPVIAPMPLPILRERMAASATWVALRGDEIEPAHPPPWAVEAIHARGEWPGIRPLAGIVEAPTLRPDGSLLSEPGYDAATGLLYLAPAGVTWPPIPKSPTRDDALVALATLDNVVCDVRFEAEHHLSGWLALVLTLVARPAIDGPVPMALIDAPVAGTGKTLVGDAACRIGTNRAMPLDGYPRTDEEFDKRTLAWACAARAVVALDNVAGRLGGESLCRALTARVVSGRVLGGTTERAATLRTVFIATGNNVQIGLDMHRRVVHVRLAAREEDPSTRTGFRHRLPEYAIENRPGLVVAALTVLRAYIAAGRPVQDMPTWGSYEAWSALVRGALVWCGRADPAEGRDELRAAADEGASLHRELVLGWRDLERVEGRPLTAKRAIDLVFRDEHPSELRAVVEALASDRRGEVSARALGLVLRSLRRRVFVVDGGAVVMLDSPPGKVAGQTRWTVQVGSDGSSSSDVLLSTREPSDAAQTSLDGPRGRPGTSLPPRPSLPDSGDDEPANPNAWDPAPDALPDDALDFDPAHLDGGADARRF